MRVPRLSGPGFKLIYERAGYSRRYIATRFKEIKQKNGDRGAVGSYHGIILIEDRKEVEPKYVQWLKTIVGIPVFESEFEKLKRDPRWKHTVLGQESV